MANGDFMGIGKKGISIMQDAIIFCIIVSIAALVVAPALLGGRMVRVYEEKENEERVNEALYTLLNSNTNDFSYLLFFNEEWKESFLGELLKRFAGIEPIHASYGELVSACLLCQIRCNGKNFNFLVKNFEKNLEKEIEKFFKKYLSGYKFNFTARWQPIVGVDFGGEISVGEEIPYANVYSSHIYILMPPSFITSFGLEIEKIKNDKEQVKEYLNDFVEEFINNILIESLKHFREKISDFIFNENEFLDNEMLNEVIKEGFSELFNRGIEGSFDYLCKEISENVKNSIINFIDENYDKIEKIDFWRAEIELAIWR